MTFSRHLPLTMLLVYLTMPTHVAGQLVIIRDNAAALGASLGAIAAAPPPVIIDMGGTGFSGNFNFTGQLAAALRERGFRVSDGADVPVGAESVVVQCYLSAGIPEADVVHFAFFIRVYYWDSRNHQIVEAWQGFGLDSSTAPLSPAYSERCVRHVEPVLRALGYG